MKIFKLKLVLTTVLSVVFLFCSGQNPLYIPPIDSGTTFNLVVRADSTPFFPSRKTPTLGINGNILAPTLLLKQGDQVTLNVSNTLNTTTTMHWHGLHVPARFDGGPHQLINPGTTWSPSFTVLNTAATYWYHPHGENKTDLQISRGLAGMIIVKDSVEESLVLPRNYGTDDFPIIIQTKCFDVLNQIAIATMFDTVPMINATIDPFLDVPAQVIRLRLLNASSDRTYLLGFSNNMSFNMIASDGGLLSAPLSIDKLLLSVGERAEILIDLAALQGQTIFLKNFGSQIPDGIMGAADVGMGIAMIHDYDMNPLNGSDFNLLQLNVVSPTTNPVVSVPSALASLNPWNPALADFTRTITFAPKDTAVQQLVEGPFTLNGHQFDMHVVNDTTYLNRVEVWTLINNTLVAHPFHIHDIQFYVSDYSNGSVPGYLQGKKDVVLVMPMDTVSFITKFENFADTIPYMYHCHLLHHEDDGMMGSFIVLDSLLMGKSKLNSELFSVYPNPSDKYLTVSLPIGQHSRYAQVSIFDFAGRLHYHSMISHSSENFIINTERFSNGIYFLSAQNEGQQYFRKFVIQHN